MNTCATCRHLGPPIVERCEWDEGHVSTLARGELPFELCNETGAKYHTCKLIVLPTDRPVGAAFAIDGEGYFAALCVSEEFGCNQWASAPEAAKHETEILPSLSPSGPMFIDFGNGLEKVTREGGALKITPVDS